MSLRCDIRKIEYWLIVVLLFFATMNFAAKFFYFALGTLVVVLLCNRKVYFHNSMLVYLALGILMGIYNFSDGFLSVIRPFAFFGVYFVGYNIGVKISKDEQKIKSLNDVEKDISIMIVTMALGAFVHYLLNFINNLGSILRNTIDIWSGSVLSATGQAMLVCMMIGLSVKMIIAPSKVWERAVGIVITILILAYNLILSGRTTIALYLVLFVIGYLYYNIKTPYKTKKVKLAISLLVVLLLTMVLYSFNVFGIKDMIMSSNLYSRLFGGELYSLMESSRNKTKLMFLKNFWTYPFGGLHMRNQFGYAHDLLLDAYDEYGIIVFVLLIAILFLGIKDLYLFLKRTNYSVPFKLEVLLVYTAVLIQFTLEPIFAAAQWLFTCYCLLNACLLALNLIDKNRKYSELEDVEGRIQM